MYEMLPHINYEVVMGKTGKYKGKAVSDTIFNFDIEDTSYYLDFNGNPVMFDYDNPEIYASYRKGSLCYHWQFSINDIVFRGRELSDFKRFVIKLHACCPARKIVYVHYLSHEFQFLLNIFKFDDVFARNSHKPLTAYIEKYNIEFRCSYMLTRLSLNTWSQKLPIKKMVGDLDYNKMRTPLTPLTDKELQYCDNDVLVMYHGIKQFKEKYGHIYSIPLTQTGEVRREVKRRLSTNIFWLQKCVSLLPTTLEDFKDELRAFIGGSVIANSLYKNTTVGNVLMFDIASSYPWVMVSEKYPLSPFKKVTGNYEKYLQDPFYAYLIEFKVYNVEAITNCKFLSKSKVRNAKNCECDNGRIIRSTEFEVTLTNIDYELFNKCYKYDKIEIHFMKVSSTNYLPDEFRKYVLELYNNKTTLKDVKGQEELYMQSKQYVNSLFGMMVTKEISDDIVFVGDEWEKDCLDTEKFLEKLGNKKRSLSKNFLSFQFGLWVTAYARRNLWSAILALDKYVVYCDTDSVKYIDDTKTDFFVKYNKNVKEKQKFLAKDLKVPQHYFYPLNPSGKKCYLGIYECENPILDGKLLYINEFKTMGAKKYILRNPKTDELEMTVAGVSKKAVKCLDNDIENFSIGKIFTERELFDCGGSKLIPSYLNDIDTTIFPDGYVNNYKYGICLTPTTYHLSITVSDILLLFQLHHEFTTELFSDSSVNRTERNKYGKIL